MVSTFVLADHGQLEPRLGGTTLCIEPLSVQADIVGPEGEAHASLEDVRARIGTALQATLSRAEVRYEVQASCAGQPAAVLLNLDARYLDPETYLGFPANAYTYAVNVQVGTFAGNENEALEEPRYATTTSDIVSLTDAEAQLLALVEPSLNELAQVWRQGNVVSFAQHLTFVGLALLLVGARAILRFAL